MYLYLKIYNIRLTEFTPSHSDFGGEKRNVSLFELVKRDTGPTIAIGKGLFL